MIMDGIEELLKLLGIDHYFSFVVTSVSSGWRKPHPDIYLKALEVSGAKPENVFFVGDDFINDYVTPESMGMKAVFLDRNENQPDLANRIKNFDQLAKLLQTRKE
jgi:putative hydrolase of the HAD superfamily